MIDVDGTVCSVRFDRFDLDAYRLFLRAKGLPESSVEYDDAAGVYTLTTDARFAPLLDESIAVAAREELPLAGHLFDYQAFIVGQALAARRYACWADTGLGKTAMFLEWARHVRDRTGRGVVILSPLSVIEQTRAEWERFYPQQQLLHRIDSREELTEFCESTAASSHPRSPIAITNYEKLIPGVIPEMRHLGGIVADESSILKTGGGTIKWNLIKSAKGVEYKLSATATPAPNEPMEYASQAAFLEKLRSEGEILWTFFQRDARGVWQVKPHAREAFYRFMASWSIYMRDPARFGFADILASLPDPVMHEHRLPMTEEQRALADELRIDTGRGLFDERQGVRERSKLAQLARGFMYEGTGPGRSVRPVASQKPGKVAAIAMKEAVWHSRQTIIWTTFDAEGEILVREIRGIAPAVDLALLTGDTKDADRLRMIGDFRAGRTRILVTKPSLVGYGLNFQNAKAMVFSGIDDSFERMYQAIRRAYRFGQTEAVHVHVPYIAELEGLMLGNVRAKERQFLDDVAHQEAAYCRALREGGLL